MSVEDSVRMEAEVYIWNASTVDIHRVRGEYGTFLAQVRFE